MQNWVVESIATLEIVCIKIEFFKKKYVLFMYRKSDPLDQEKVNNKAMIKKTADICVQKWVAESKAKLTLKLNVAFFCYRKGKTSFLC